MAAIAGRVPHGGSPRNGQCLTWRGWLPAAIAAVAVIAALKLAGVIWTSASPPWTTALGAGVTVTAPEQVAPGHGSPGAALTGVLAALSSKNPAAACNYLFTGSSGGCSAPPGPGSDRLPYGVSVKIGYVAVAGTRALVGFTGKIRSPTVPPACMTNANPAAVFSTGSTFAALWARSVTGNSGIANEYRLLPCTEVDGNWYVGSGPA